MFQCFLHYLPVCPGARGVTIHPWYLGMYVTCFFETVFYVDCHTCVTLGWLEELFTSQVCLGLLLEAAKLPGLLYFRLLITELVQRRSCQAWCPPQGRRAPQVGFYFGKVGAGGGGGGGRGWYQVARGSSAISGKKKLEVLTNTTGVG